MEMQPIDKKKPIGSLSIAEPLQHRQTKSLYILPRQISDLSVYTIDQAWQTTDENYDIYEICKFWGLLYPPLP